MNERPATLVTGATSDIGTAICRKFASTGHHVLAHARDPERGQAVVDAIVESGASAELVVADLRDDSAPDAIMQTVRSSGAQLTGLVNNAGGVLEHTFRPGIPEDPTESYKVNVFAAYSLSMLAAPLMAAGGSIVNISSIHAHAPWGARIPHYSASKAALSHLTQMLAIKFAPTVRVNAVSPGRTRTAAWGDLGPEADAALAKDALIERWIAPNEIADAVWFLTANGACTGTDLIIDGGIGLKAAQANT